MGITNNYVSSRFSMKNGPVKKLIQLCISFVIILAFAIQPLSAAAAESTPSDSNTAAGSTASTVGLQGGELHAFYPSNAVFSDKMQQYIDSLDSVSFAFSRIDAGDSGNLNTVKGKNGNYSFYYPTDFLQPIKYAKSKGKSIQLNVYMDSSDCTKLLPYAEEQSAMLQAIVNAMQADITQGEGVYYDGVVIDFEGLRNTDAAGTPILYNGNQISTYFIQFLKELRVQLDSIGKKLYVAVNPALYYDGYNYSDILSIADRVIIMAHDYEPTEKLKKSQVEQYTGYDALEPIDSLAPIQKIRQALNDIQKAASDSTQLQKVWLQISFDTAQWQFDAGSATGWEKLPDTALSKKGRLSPLYKSIKARVDNTDGYGQNISYGYNNELQSPYIQYYNSSDKSWNVMIYEDSTSISAKIEMAKTYGLGGISLWSLSNMPDYTDSLGKKFHLNGWTTIIAKMNSYDTLPAASSKYVSFSDSAIEKAVREKLGKTSGKISLQEVQSIYRLKLPKGVKSLKNLSYLTNLEYLDASQLGLKDIASVKSLTKLRVLYLQRNSVSDISALKKLTQLEVLSLNGNKLTSVSALSSLKNLRELYLRENKIQSLAGLSQLLKLETLEAGKNSIQSTDSLKNLKKLQHLALDNNQISSITGLKALTSLKYLDLSANKIKSIASLKKLTNLKELYLKGNSISDYSPVKAVYSKKGFLCDFKVK
ncbi:leucine-rich repeat domain-containing protein [Anaerocolumna xylanovorans]|uniref:Internalin A n=1 Tax=Anaerocolumna xylanovorans DSM 12503 TaxID=1121345 RepID=A0A1M7YGY5_9FIRM|nr:leucine-rich repeat domain-containing protein [Anaerocolumna xylanovorans]SHO51895.1 internalin A [Anaerocolumna xylanovorans DSM 12503]